MVKNQSNAESVQTVDQTSTNPAGSTLGKTQNPTNKSAQSTPTQPAPHKNKGNNKIYLFALGIFGVNVLLTVLTFRTTSADFARGAANITFWSGLVGSLLLGIGVAVKIGSKDTLSRLTIYGIVLILVSVIFSIITFIPGLILLIAGSKNDSDPNLIPISKTVKIILTIVSFFAAGIVGLVVTFFMWLSNDMKACTLTSSKCL